MPQSLWLPTKRGLAVVGTSHRFDFFTGPNIAQYSSSYYIRGDYIYSIRLDLTYGASIYKTDLTDVSHRWVQVPTISIPQVMDGRINSQVAGDEIWMFYEDYGGSSFFLRLLPDDTLIRTALPYHPDDYYFFNGDLYAVGGTFSAPVARWTGSAWESGPYLNGDLYFMSGVDDHIYMSLEYGEYTYVYQWDGIGTPAIRIASITGYYNIRSILRFNGNLYVCKAKYPDSYISKINPDGTLTDLPLADIGVTSASLGIVRDGLMYIYTKQGYLLMDETERIVGIIKFPLNGLSFIAPRAINQVYVQDHLRNIYKVHEEKAKVMTLRWVHKGDSRRLTI